MFESCSGQATDVLTVFHEFDTTNDGEIDIQEFKGALQVLALVLGLTLTLTPTLILALTLTLAWTLTLPLTRCLV